MKQNPQRSEQATAPLPAQPKVPEAATEAKAPSGNPTFAITCRQCTSDQVVLEIGEHNLIMTCVNCKATVRM